MECNEVFEKKVLDTCKGYWQHCLKTDYDGVFAFPAQDLIYPEEFLSKYNDFVIISLDQECYQKRAKKLNDDVSSELLTESYFAMIFNFDVQLLQGTCNFEMP